MTEKVCHILNLFWFCEQKNMQRKMRIRSHLLKKSLMGNFIFCAVEIAADLSIIPEKFMEESKEIKRNWTGPKNFLIYLCAIFGSHD